MGPQFNHEKLHVYQRSLDVVGWLDSFLRETQLTARRGAGLDATTASLVLNIAEGNGRYSSTDHRRFLDIAHTCAINTTAALDLLVAKGCVTAVQIVEGKRILGGVVPMLFGLRGYLDKQRS